MSMNANTIVHIGTARSARAQRGGVKPLRSAAGRILAAARAIVAWLDAYDRRRETIRELDRLGDDTLRDIGLVRLVGIGATRYARLAHND